jgi:2-oxoglutarate ferredoxin oxidoreductase subunit delta
MANVTIHAELCKGCSLCVAACPKKIVALDESVINKKGVHPAIVTDMAACTACTFCAIVCPDAVVTIEK